MDLEPILSPGGSPGVTGAGATVAPSSLVLPGIWTPDPGGPLNDEGLCAASDAGFQFGGEY